MPLTPMRYKSYTWPHNPRVYSIDYEMCIRDRVDTGRGQRGLQSFLDQYLDSMLTCGQGVGEMVLDREGGDIAALLCADPGQIEIREGETPLEFRLCTRGRDGQPVELPWQELLLFTPFQPGTDNPYGVSLLRSMPFLSGILLKIRCV